MSENDGLWKKLGLNLEKHGELLAKLDDDYSEVYSGQQNRPESMEYFDSMLSDFHGLRIRELMEHKKSGGKIVGTFCLFVPEELIVAAGGIAIKLDGGMQLPVSDAETVLPAELCPMIKSTLGLKMSKTSPYFELVDFIVGETSCDGKKKAWEIFNNYIPAYVMELPQKKTQMDRELWLREMFALKEKMEVESGVKITPENLARSIGIFNEKRKAFARLYALRRKSPSLISGRDANLVSQVSCYDDPERFTVKVNELCEELEGRAERNEAIAAPGTPRIMITGCPMVLPNWKLHNLIETGGAVVVCEDTCSGARYFMDPLIRAEDSTSSVKQLKAIADRYLNIACPCFTPGYCGVLQMSEMVEDYSPEGVIYYVLQFCHGFNIEFYKMEKRLKELGVPVLKVQTDYTEEDTGQLRTRIEAFLERITGGK